MCPNRPALRYPWPLRLHTTYVERTGRWSLLSPAGSLGGKQLPPYPRQEHHRSYDALSYDLPLLFSFVCCLFLFLHRLHGYQGLASAATTSKDRGRVHLFPSFILFFGFISVDAFPPTGLSFVFVFWYPYEWDTSVCCKHGPPLFPASWPGLIGHHHYRNAGRRGRVRKEEKVCEKGK